MLLLTILVVASSCSKEEKFEAKEIKPRSEK